MANVLLVFIGGGIGASGRYGVSLLCTRLWGSAFPSGTLVVNLAGCFCIGLLFSLATERGAIGPAGRLFLMTGILGGLTTFSSYGLESVRLAMEGARWSALANILLNNVGGLALAVIGMWLGRGR